MGYPWTMIKPVSRSSNWDTTLNAALDVFNDFATFNNAPTNGYVLAWNQTSNILEWVANGSGSDTGEVRMNAGDAKEYLDAKLSTGLENDGSDNLRVTVAISAGAALSLYNSSS